MTYKKGDKLIYRPGNSLYLFTARVKCAHRNGEITVELMRYCDSTGKELSGALWVGDEFRIDGRNIVGPIPAR